MSPQSTYLGALLQLPESLPCTLTGHEISNFIQIPADPQKKWPLEALYPSDARICIEMNKMMPLEHLRCDFPVHTSTTALPLVHRSIETQQGLAGSEPTNIPEICGVRPQDTVSHLADKIEEAPMILVPNNSTSDSECGQSSITMHTEDHQGAPENRNLLPEIDRSTILDHLEQEIPISTLEASIGFDHHNC
ncbi:hypothetical protein B0H10DRAFT_1943239 [Mycena sp. CBHHK59/15]|nr:hypothetical protein B0H10DRAFT_1943239 [Mycena sp. CBHHK59/15]